MNEPMPLTMADAENIKAACIMLQMARNRQPHKREAFYKAAGQHLEHLRRGKVTEVWAELVRKYCGLGLSRAYELVEIANGRSLKELRAQKQAATRRWKASKNQKMRNNEVKSGA